MFKKLRQPQGSILLGLLLAMLIIAMLSFGFSFFGKGQKGQVETYQNTLEDLEDFKVEYDEAQRQQLEMLEE